MTIFLDLLPPPLAAGLLPRRRDRRPPPLSTSPDPAALHLSLSRRHPPPLPPILPLSSSLPSPGHGPSHGDGVAAVLRPTETASRLSASPPPPARSHHPLLPPDPLRRLRHELLQASCSSPDLLLRRLRRACRLADLELRRLLPTAGPAPPDLEEVRGSGQDPESEIVQACRSLLDEKQGVNVCRFLKLINERHDLTEALKKFQCRTLIFVGENFQFHADAVHMTTKLDRRYCALVEVQACGSLVTEEHLPSWFICIL